MSYYVKARVKNTPTELFLSSNMHKLTGDPANRAWFTSAKRAAEAKSKASSNYATVAPWLKFSVEANRVAAPRGRSSTGNRK